MNRKKIFGLMLTLAICFCFLPTNVFAVTISRTKYIWTGNNHLNYASLTYNTKGYSSKRTTSNLAAWKTDGNSRVFCVEPTVKFNQNSISGYTKITSDREFSKLTKKNNHRWDVYQDLEHLKKVFSCWDDNDASIMATQAIVWELVTEERDNLDASKILNDNYTPYQSNGSVYGNQSGITSLYSLITKRTKVYNAYKAVLRCAARFKEYVSFTKTTTSAAYNNPLRIDGNFTAATETKAATWTKTFTHSTSNKQNKDVLNYYDVTSSSSDVKVKITKNGTSLEVTTSKEILASNPVRITFKYAYKDNGSSRLNTNENAFYVKKDGNAFYQTLGNGSTSLTSYMYVYTGSAPKYQLRVRKIDKTTGQPMSGVKFKVYDKKGNEIGTTNATDASGYAYYNETGSNAITKTGEYQLKEVGVASGYLKNNQTITVKVTDSDRTGTNNYAESSSVFENTQNELKLTKKTIDENGNFISLAGDSCTVKTCPSEGGRQNGPIFTMKKDNKYVCVTENSNGHYTYHSLAATCPANTTNEIKTCNGAFDIKKIPVGTYYVTETATACGYTLPSEENLTKTVVVKEGENPSPITFVNGVTGAIFNKVSEDGETLDGGKYSLQQKVNGIYKDLLLKHDSGSVYSYVEKLEDGSTGATYELETNSGLLQVKHLPIGEYRFVEKQAPEGYDIIKDKDSRATFTISDKGIFGSDGKPRTDYYEVKLVNQKTKIEGSYDSAELIVTIITGRKVANYTLIIAGLAVLLTILIIIRKKSKK